MKKLLIGIDPDVDKNGVCFYNGTEYDLENLTFFELFDFLNFYKEREQKPTVYIEKGSLNNSNWHIKQGNSAAFNSKIGENTGRNFETANKIIEMCQYLKLPYVEIKPTRKKIDSETFKKISGINKRTNQEQRDAFMLIYGR
jgi:hypothetical protein